MGKGGGRLFRIQELRLHIYKDGKGEKDSIPTIYKLYFIYSLFKRASRERGGERKSEG